MDVFFDVFFVFIFPVGLAVSALIYFELQDRRASREEREAELSR